MPYKSLSKPTIDFICYPENSKKRAYEYTDLKQIHYFLTSNTEIKFPAAFVLPPNIDIPVPLKQLQNKYPQASTYIYRDKFNHPISRCYLIPVSSKK